MKALLCGYCGDIRALGYAGAGKPLTDWVSCMCERTVARWVDPERGIAEFKKPRGFGTESYCFVLGLNNHLLTPAMQGQLAMFQDFREAHEKATNAPSHVFDKSRAGCWAVVMRVGTTNDVSWAEEGTA